MTNHQKKAICLTVGIFWGLTISIVTLISYYTDGYAAEFLEVIKSVYIVFSVSPKGAFLVFFFGFIDGFIGSFILISLYQFIEKRIK